MKSIIQLVGEHLERHEIKAQVEDNLLICAMRNEHGGWRMVVDTDEAGKLLSVLSFVAVRVPLEQRATFAQALMRLNAGWRLGAWHLNLDDGELLYCVSVPTAGLPENLDATMDSVFKLALSQVGKMQARLAEHAFQWNDAKEQPLTDTLVAEARIQFN